MDNKAHRIMGLDYGDVRIGVALSDVTHLIAVGSKPILGKPTN